MWDTRIQNVLVQCNNESKLIKIIENTEHLKNILIDWIVNN